MSDRSTPIALLYLLSLLTLRQQTILFDPDDLDDVRFLVQALEQSRPTGRLTMLPPTVERYRLEHKLEEDLL